MGLNKQVNEELNQAFMNILTRAVMFEVFKKELKELLRDRKTLIFVVALPVAIFHFICCYGIY